MKKAKILSLILASVMLLSLVPMTVFAADVTAPTTLPDLVAGVYKAGYLTSGYTFNNTDGSTDTAGGLLDYNDKGALPLYTQGEAFTATEFFSGNAVSQYYGGTETTIDLDASVEVPDDATGVLVKVTFNSTTVNAALRFSPILSDGSTVYSTETKEADYMYVYYYDSANANWRATVASHSYRVGDKFEGYIYIPFEAYRAKVGVEGMLTSALARTLSITGFKLAHTWGNSAETTSYSVQSAAFVSVAAKMPSYLPNLNVDNEDNVRDGVWKGGYSADVGYTFNNTDGSIDTDMGRLNVGDKGSLPVYTQGQTFTTTNVYNDTAIASEVLKEDKSFELDDYVDIPDDATGFMIKVEVESNANGGIRFNPDFYDANDGTGTAFNTETKEEDTPYVYYYDFSTGVWRASVATHSFRIPANFSGYIYIPFEAYRAQVGETAMLSTEQARELYLKGFRLSSVWGTTAYKVTSVDIVSVPVLQPYYLPDIEAGVYEAGYDNGAYIFNNADGSINTAMGTMDTASNKILPSSTWGQKIDVVPFFTGNAVSGTYGGTETTVTLDDYVAVPDGTTGVLVKVSATSDTVNAAVRFSPIFYDAPEAGATMYSTETKGDDAMYVYYYDSANASWRATVASHSYRIGGNFEGYLYIPFEAYRAQVGQTAMLTTELASTLYVKGFKIAHTWGSGDNGKTNFSVQSVAFVTIPTMTDASVSVTDNLNINIYANSAAAGATLTVTPANPELPTKTLTGEYVASLGQYRFTYDNILPQYMTEEFDLVLSYNGKVADTTENFSIRSYCLTLLEGATDGDVLSNVLVDMLNYGAAAQLKADHKTDALANAGVTNQGTDASNKVVTNPVGIANSTDAGKYFTSASVVLENAIALRLNMALDTTEQVVVKVTINGYTETYTAADITAVAGGYTILFKGIYATEYDDVITATIEVNGTVVQTLTYSVNAYLDSVTDAEWTALADAVYAYGNSAAAYADAKKN